MKEIKIVVKNLLTKKTAGSVGSVGEVYRTFKEEIMPVPYRLFQETEKEDISQLYEASMALMSNPNKDTKGKKSLTNISHEYRHRSLYNCSKLNLAVHTRACAQKHTH